MSAIDQRSTAELRRLRDRATNETIRELLNAELMRRWEDDTPKRFFGRVWNHDRPVKPARWVELPFSPNPGQP